MNFLTLFNGFGCFMGALLVEMVYVISEGKNRFMVCLHIYIDLMTRELGDKILKEGLCQCSLFLIDPLLQLR